MKIKTISPSRHIKLVLVAVSLGFFMMLSVPVQAAAPPPTAGSQQPTQVQVNLEDSIKQNQITKDLQLAVNIMAGAVGVIVVIMLLLGGTQYILAGDKAEATAAARKRMTNAVIALVAFFFMYAFLQWIIPGGIFG